MDPDFEDGFAPARVAVLLKEFSQLDDDREPWRVMYPLAEMLLLVTCATVASCDDFDDIVAFGKHHLHDLRRFAPFHHGVPCARWMRALVNRIDPVLFGACFESWIKAMWPDRHDLIGIDGKTSRRTHDKRKGLKALHTLSAYASNARLVLGQVSVPEKANAITAIPDLLDHLATAGHLKGELVTIDAMGTQVEIAAKIVSHGADYLLPLKGNQPTLEADVEAYFRTAPASELVAKTTVEKGHGRIETRVFTASRSVEWLLSDRSYPGQPRFAGINSVVKVYCRTEHADRSTFETRHYICSSRHRAIGQRRPGPLGRREHALAPRRRVQGRPVTLQDRQRAKNMAVIRRFALNLVRINPQKGTVKTKRKSAGWDPAFLREILGLK